MFKYVWQKRRSCKKYKNAVSFAQCMRMESREFQLLLCEKNSQEITLDDCTIDSMVANRTMLQSPAIKAESFPYVMEFHKGRYTLAVYTAVEEVDCSGQENSIAIVSYAICWRMEHAQKERKHNPKRRQLVGTYEGLLAYAPEAPLDDAIHDLGKAFVEATRQQLTRDDTQKLESYMIMRIYTQELKNTRN